MDNDEGQHTDNSGDTPQPVHGDSTRVRGRSNRGTAHEQQQNKQRNTNTREQTLIGLAQFYQACIKARDTLGVRLTHFESHDKESLAKVCRIELFMIRRLLGRVRYELALRGLVLPEM